MERHRRNASALDGLTGGVFSERRAWLLHPLAAERHLVLHARHRPMLRRSRELMAGRTHDPTSATVDLIFGAGNTNSEALAKC